MILTMGKTWVYIMSAGEHIKVGVSDNPKSRRKQLSTGCPYEITIKALVGPVSRDVAIQIEKSVHMELQGFHQKGEWFCVNAHDVYSVASKFGFVFQRENTKQHHKQLNGNPRIDKTKELKILILSLPFIQSVLSGDIGSWTNKDEICISAKAWAIENSDKIKHLSMLNKRWHGFQFTHNTYPVAALNRLLKICGYSTKCIRQENRARVYRLDIDTP